MKRRSYHGLMSEFDLTLDRNRLAQVRHGAVVVTTDSAVFRVHGPGALSCLQGLLTNDLVKPGDNSLVYGALLTPKGAVVVDYWVLRQPDAITLIAPRSGREPSLELFRRQLPPRLAKVSDQTDQARVAWLLGAHGFQTLASSGVPLPEATGRVASVGGEVSPVALALAPETAPFVALAVGAEPAIAALPGGAIAAAWVAYRDRADRVFLRTRANNIWSAPEQVTTKTGDIFRCAVAADTAGNLWVFWSERLNDRWQLWGRQKKGAAWQAPERLARQC